MTPLDQLRCMARAIELCEGDHFTEAEALRLAYLEQRERPQEPQLQIPLKEQTWPTPSALG